LQQVTGPAGRACSRRNARFVHLLNNSDGLQVDILYAFLIDMCF
jgi:hypothetical protein